MVTSFQMIISSIINVHGDLQITMHKILMTICRVHSIECARLYDPGSSVGRARKKSPFAITRESEAEEWVTSCTVNADVAGSNPVRGLHTYSGLVAKR